jgi:murein DD-endopeptidase MepM/ murein hydrolase activator NlpD
MPVIAANSGKIIYTGSGFSGYGRMVLIDHQNGFITLYAHLRSINTRRGRVVRKGEIIGKVGTSGRATGPHLHFEVRYHEKLVNPLRYMTR